MKTLEEKARIVARKSMSLCMDNMEEEDIYIDDLTILYIAGYTEALRWRDADKEQPDEYTQVLIKTKTGHYVGIYCTEKEYCNWFDSTEPDVDCQLHDVIAWRYIQTI